MFEVQQALSFIPPTTSENYWSHLMKANYSWALSLLVLLQHSALTLRQEYFHLHLRTPFYWNQKDSIFQSLSREGWAGGRRTGSNYPINRRVVFSQQQKQLWTKQ